MKVISSMHYSPAKGASLLSELALATREGKCKCVIG